LAARAQGRSDLAALSRRGFEVSKWESWDVRYPLTKDF
jgi:hypothetical protein